MLQNESIMYVGDNSGAKQLRIINTRGRRSSEIGDIVSCSVIKAAPNNPSNDSSAKFVKRKQVVTALIVNTRRGISRKDGTYLRFSKNYAIIVEKLAQGKKVKGESYSIVSNRINVPLPLELSFKGFGSFFPFAKEII